MNEKLGYWGRVWENFKTTNTAIPGLLAPTGTGLITAGATAEALGTTTLLPWATSGFGGATLSGATFTAVETGALVVSTAAVNFSLASVAYEAGVFIGSMVSAAPVYGTDQTVGEWWGNAVFGQ